MTEPRISPELQNELERAGLLEWAQDQQRKFHDSLRKDLVVAELPAPVCEDAARVLADAVPLAITIGNAHRDLRQQLGKIERSLKAHPKRGRVIKTIRRIEALAIDLGGGR